MLLIMAWIADVRNEGAVWKWKHEEQIEDKKVSGKKA